MLNYECSSSIIIRNKNISYKPNGCYNSPVVASIQIYPQNKCFNLHSFGVKEEHRCKGLGTRILRYIIKNSDKPIKLWVVRDNVRAQKLYLKLGFRYVEDTNFEEYSWQMVYDKHTSVA